MSDKIHFHTYDISNLDKSFNLGCMDNSYFSSEKVKPVSIKELSSLTEQTVKSQDELLRKLLTHCPYKIGNVVAYQKKLNGPISSVGVVKFISVRSRFDDEGKLDIGKVTPITFRLRLQIINQKAGTFGSDQERFLGHLYIDYPKQHFEYRHRLLSETEEEYFDKYWEPVQED